MPFHLNGFIPGDPHLAPASPQAAAHTDAVPAQVDVLIVGCGPAGLTLAAQLAEFADIRTCIVEAKDGPLQLGQADGIACRTMEMFEAFNFAERVLKEACWINEVTFWKPDEKRPGNIQRHGRVQDTEDGLSEFPHVVLNQARVHDFYLENMRNSPSRLEPHYSRRFVDLAVDRTAADYPVTVTLERTDPAHAGQVETVKARYVVGCDGARSGVRKSIGRQLVGDSANQAWGVMDVLAVTDFPDIRYKAAVQSEHGNLLVIPREGGYMARLYVEMDKLGEDERVAHRNITLDQLIAAAQRIFHPYKLDVKEVPWWSVYEIGQRICHKYDDVPDGSGREVYPHVFIAGDACHTHSPKAGQGMNFSMQDAFNLGWKLAAVLRGQATPALLHTYSAERQVVAQRLIDFDREWAKMFSDRPKQGAGEAGQGVDPKEFQKYFEQHGRFTAGPVPLPRGVAAVSGASLHSRRRGRGCRVRPARDLPAVASQPGHRCHALAAAPGQGAPRPARLREGLLPQPQGRPGHLRPARHRPRAGRPGGGPPRPVHRSCAAAGCAPGTGGFLRGLHVRGRSRRGLIAARGGAPGCTIRGPCNSKTSFFPKASAPGVCVPAWCSKGLSRCRASPAPTRRPCSSPRAWPTPCRAWPGPTRPRRT